MSDKPEYISCIKCGETLYYAPIAVSVGLDIDLPYCPNRDCDRYMLYTMEPDEA